MGGKCCSDRKCCTDRKASSASPVPVHAGDHPVAAAAEHVYQLIKFVRAECLERVAVPWPRSQDLSADHFDNPRADDIVVSISHGWPYQAHPDPLGLKRTVILKLLEQAKLNAMSSGDVRMFYDFLGVSQRPFREGQVQRTERMNALFPPALQAMPRIYLMADSVFHIEMEWSEVPGDGEEVEVACADLNHADFLQLGDEVQVSSIHHGKKVAVKLFDIILTIDGKPVQTLAQLEEARSAVAISESPLKAKVCRRPFGRPNKVPAGERGWVYLERFCSMVKIAMVDESQAEKVVYSNEPQVLDELLKGGGRLRQAAKDGEGPLQQALDGFFQELGSKKFSTVPSADAQAAGDREVVASIMRDMVAHLPGHWEAEVRAQKRRLHYVRMNRVLAATRTAKMIRGDSGNVSKESVSKDTT